MIKNFEKDMADALEQMRSEKDRASIEIDTLKAQVSFGFTLDKVLQFLPLNERCQFINYSYLVKYMFCTWVISFVLLMIKLLFLYIT